MKKSRKPSVPISAKSAPYEIILADVVNLLEQSRLATARAVNAVITTTYWQIGRRIVEGEQQGRAKAEYGEQMIDRLAIDLTARFGRGFGRSNLFQMRAFYLNYSSIVQMPSARSRALANGNGGHLNIVQTPSGQLSAVFPLPWSHYVRLMSVKNDLARQFYETEALRGGWSVKQLDRQIGSQFYERTALSRDKALMLTKGTRAKPQDYMAVEEQIKDPLVLEFLDLKDEYSESDLEEALIHHLESFLLELGGDWTFVGRQRRLRIDDTWYRIDLLFFHRVLRCLVIFDLKLAALTPADIGQMHLYCNYAKAHWTRPGENPPIGIILCSSQGESLARYALEGLPNPTLVRQYRTALPDEKLLADEIAKTRRILEARESRGTGRTQSSLSAPNTSVPHKRKRKQGTS